MQRILVIGCPGSGKSVFSKALCRATGIPLHHLDNMFWNPDRTTVDRAVFIKRLSSVMEKSRWIIDGDYASTMEMRMHACDTVFFLDYPTDVCLTGVRERRGRARSDLPWVEPCEDDQGFLEMVQNYRVQKRPTVLFLLKRYAHKRIFVFTSRGQAEAFLEKLCDESVGRKE